MIHKNISKTVDVYPQLLPMERHVQFIESRERTISCLRYQEILKAHFKIKK